MNRSWLATCSSASGWAAGAAIGLTNDEQTFLDAGLAGREARQAAEEARLARELETAQQLAETEKARAEAESWRAEEQSRSAQRLRWLAVGLTLVLLLAVGAAWLAIDQGQTAQKNADLAATNEAVALDEADRRATAQAVVETERELAEERRLEAEDARATAVAEGQRADANAEEEAHQREAAELAQAGAEEQAHLATSRELSLAAINNLEADPELAMLLALEALETQYTRGAEETLHRALQASRVELAWKGHDATVQGLAYSPEGTRLASFARDESEVRVWEAQTGVLVSTLPLRHVIGPTGQLWYDENGDRLSALTRDSDYEHLILTKWDTASGRIEVTHTLPITTETFAGFAASPDGALIVVGYERGASALWDVATGKKLFDFPVMPGWH